MVVPKYFSSADVKSVLSWALVNAAVEEALIANVQSNKIKTSYASRTARTFTQIHNDPTKLLLTMPAFVGNYHLSGKPTNTLTCKLVTSFADNNKQTPALPSIQAHIMLFDDKTGSLKAILDGTDITTWRTAAASVLATKHLYIRKSAPSSENVCGISVGIVGCGVQGTIHAKAMCSNFNVYEILLWNRTRDKAIQLANHLKQQFSKTVVRVCNSAAEAVCEMDVICIATNSPEPLICFNDVKHKKSVHINAIGAGQVHFGELSQDIYDNFLTYVDSYENARHELKSLKATIVGELGEVILCQIPVPSDSYTIFQSMGLAAEDACVGQAVYNALEATTLNKNN